MRLVHDCDKQFEKICVGEPRKVGRWVESEGVVGNNAIWWSVRKVCIAEDGWCWEERQSVCVVLLRSDEVLLEGLQADV